MTNDFPSFDQREMLAYLPHSRTYMSYYVYWSCWLVTDRTDDRECKVLPVSTAKTKELVLVIRTYLQWELDGFVFHSATFSIACLVQIGSGHGEETHHMVVIISLGVQGHDV